MPNIVTNAMYPEEATAPRRRGSLKSKEQERNGTIGYAYGASFSRSDGGFVASHLSNFESISRRFFAGVWLSILIQVGAGNVDGMKGDCRQKVVTRGDFYVA
jgi:hypothetical protein